MKYWLLFILLFALTGCCRVAELPPWPPEPRPDMTPTLYRFRLERSTVPKFSGLLALQPRAEGIWSGLLDATGVPLIKMLTFPDGATQLKYCAAALRDSRMPELLGKMVEYIYFTPAAADCPWHVFSCVCFEEDGPGHTVKWRKMGPFSLWRIEKAALPAGGERIIVHMNVASIIVHLDSMDTNTGKQE